MLSITAFVLFFVAPLIVLVLGEMLAKKCRDSGHVDAANQVFWIRAAYGLAVVSIFVTPILAFLDGRETVIGTPARGGDLEDRGRYKRIGTAISLPVGPYYDVLLSKYDEGTDKFQEPPDARWYRLRSKPPEVFRVVQWSSDEPMFAVDSDPDSDSKSDWAERYMKFCHERNTNAVLIRRGQSIPVGEEYVVRFNALLADSPNWPDRLFLDVRKVSVSEANTAADDQWESLEWSSHKSSDAFLQPLPASPSAFYGTCLLKTESTTTSIELNLIYGDKDEILVSVTDAKEAQHEVAIKK